MAKALKLKIQESVPADTTGCMTAVAGVCQIAVVMDLLIPILQQALGEVTLLILLITLPQALRLLLMVILYL